jgi:protein-S-isoprenylcysteine O-methyltransferase Ste14
MPPPLLFALPMVAGYLVNRVLPLEASSDLLRGLGVVLVALSLIPGPWALVVMLRSGVNPEPHVPTAHLVVKGPFRFTRNPIYVTYFLFVAGLGLVLGNLWMLILLVPTLVVTHYGVILREERYLSRRFGTPYNEYRQRVRRWL